MEDEWKESRVRAPHRNRDNLNAARRRFRKSPRSNIQKRAKSTPSDAQTMGSDPKVMHPFFSKSKPAPVAPPRASTPPPDASLAQLDAPEPSSSRLPSTPPERGALNHSPTPVIATTRDVGRAGPRGEKPVREAPGVATSSDDLMIEPNQPHAVRSSTPRELSGVSGGSYCVPSTGSEQQLAPKSHKAGREGL